MPLRGAIGNNSVERGGRRVLAFVAQTSEPFSIARNGFISRRFAVQAGNLVR